MTTQLAIKLPDEIVAEVDRLVAEGAFVNRSQAVRRAVEVLVAAHRRREIDAAFAEGFQRLPDTDEELADAARLAVESINDEPWERWW
ncbi:MAG: ribbon-helix-helix domain-containing protein [Acidimicrobiales bacterium]